MLSQLGRHDEALPVLHEAVRQQRLAFDRAPHVLRYRQALSTHYATLAETARALGRPGDAAVALRERRALWPDEPRELVRVAGDLALTAAVVGKGKADLTPEENAERDGYAEEAVAVLRQAVAVGFRDGDRLQKDPNLAVLRGRGDFQELLAGLRK